MKNVYLVQRINAPQGVINPFAFGGGKVNGGFALDAMKQLRNIISFDYMGAAEFEWGAVPTAFEALFTSKPIKTEIQEVDKWIGVICSEDLKLEAIAWIKEAAHGRHGHLKEHLGLKEALEGKKHTNTKGWIKIEKDKSCEEPFMFFVDKEMFENICKLFNV